MTANILTGLGIDEFFTRADLSGTQHLLPDALGSIIALTDPTGTVQTEYRYEPFGRTIATGAPSPNPFQYTGREDDGFDLYYYRARYYHTVLQRFISEDPLDFYGGDTNLYAYVSNNSTNFVDPTGRWMQQIRPFLQQLARIAILLGRLAWGGKGAEPPTTFPPKSPPKILSPKGIFPPIPGEPDCGRKPCAPPPIPFDDPDCWELGLCI